VDNELGRIWMEVVVAKFDGTIQALDWENLERHEKLMTG
jgi:hypothetical protein